MAGWSARDIPDLRGRRAIVTGANSGLGYHISLELARRGASVVMACRDPARGEQAVARVRRAVPSAAVELGDLDLADLASVRAFARGQANAGLDLLVNNAGVMHTPYLLTADGFELQFGTNHLGHFALTGLLLPALADRPGARVVTMSSLLHRSGAIAFDDLQAERGYDPQRAYAQSKLANLLFAFELHRRAVAAGLALWSMAAHPGYAATNLQATGPRMGGSRSGVVVMTVANTVFAQSAAAGALPALYAATAPTAEPGGYYGPRGVAELRGRPRTVRATRAAHDVDLAGRLWAVSEELTGVKYWRDGEPAAPDAARES